MGHQFPLYRKHASGKSYFIILSDTEYKEFQFVGKQIFRYEFKIKTYFDHIFVISHNTLIRNWSDNLLMVKKEDNVSSVDYITPKIS